MVAVSGLAGLNSTQLALITWVLSLHLWFVPVYLITVSLTPLAVAAQQSWGLKAPATLAVGVAAVDAITLGAHVPMLGWVNYALCWGAIYQIGVSWFGGDFRGRRPALLALAAAAVLASVIGLGWYPVSMIGVPSQSIQNTSPPTVALLSLAAVQAGLLVTAAPAVSARLRGPNPRRYLATGNDNAFALYLWHMIPVVVVALVAYPLGLLTQPDLGSASWWLWRLAWVAVLSATTVALLALLWLGRSAFARPMPTIGVALPARLSALPLVAGLAMAAYALWRFAADGFAPMGHLPVLTSASYVAGVALMSLSPVDADQRGRTMPA
jgi:hypothetical protein